MQNVFIIGSKGIPGSYGGYETFVDKLTEYHQNEEKLQYHVACKSHEHGEIIYHNARCFKIKVPDIGPAQAIFYDVLALKDCCEYISKNNVDNAIIYILACRIGPFAHYFQNKIHKLGGKVYVNPDGHEWKRAKWSLLVRKYWKISEKLMVKNSDLLICDSKNIKMYIHENYGRYSPKTKYIAYGAETRPSIIADTDKELMKWYEKWGLKEKSYYLIVGRFVPENNYETMINEFMLSKTQKDLCIITNVGDKFYRELKEKTRFDKDARIKFVGTVYDKELLMKIRENAYGYLHGHEVGGTNPSLLEALGSTELNLLLEVGFNKEVAEQGALYWGKARGSLSALIDKADAMNSIDIKKLGELAKQRIKTSYSWSYICEQYKELFLKGTE